MQATPNMESVTLSLPHDDMAVLRLLSKRMGWKMKARSATPPCQYTEEEVVQRVLQATADVDAGRGLISHEEFKKQVQSWLNSYFATISSSISMKTMSARV